MVETADPKFPGAWFRSVSVFDAKGALDIKRTLKNVEVAITEWQKEESEIKPAVLEELKTYGKLGQAKLVQFVIHRLNLKPIKENEERVLAVLDEMTRTGKINYQTTESGTKRGRGTGYALSTPPPANQ